MTKCDKCKVGIMKKSTSGFGWVIWYCPECGHDETINKFFKKPKNEKETK